MSEEPTVDAFPWLKERVKQPASQHHLRTMDISQLTEEMVCDSTQVKNLFWYPIPDMIAALSRRCQGSTAVLDVGCGWTPFPSATHLVDWSPAGTHPGKSVFPLDVDTDTFPFMTNAFDFVYSRHMLEDIQNPVHAFQEMVRVGQRGHFETPSPLVELLLGVDTREDLLYRGYIHHRYIVWSEQEDNSLHFLPKYPIIEYITMSESLTHFMTYLANHFPVYWNNYYSWDKSPAGTTHKAQGPQGQGTTHKAPKVVMHRNEFDFDFRTKGEYEKLLIRAIFASLTYTNAFVAGIPTSYS